MKNNIFKLLSDILLDDTSDVKTLDLSKNDDYKKFNEYIDECRSICNSDDSASKLTKSLFELLFDEDMNNVLDEIKDCGDSIHNEAVKNEKKNETKKVPELPSKSTPMDKQLHLHKIVGQYVDEYIRPYGNMNKEVVDDVYAGLFEFACWVMNR